MSIFVREIHNLLKKDAIYHASGEGVLVERLIGGSRIHRSFQPSFEVSHFVFIFNESEKLFILLL